MTFRSYETNTTDLIYPNKRIDLEMIYNSIGAKLQQAGLQSSLSYGAPAGFWQGVGCESRVISIIERGLFYLFITVCYTKINVQVQIRYSPIVTDRNYTDSVHAMRCSQWDLCARTVNDAAMSSILEVAGRPLFVDGQYSNGYVFHVDPNNLVTDFYGVDSNIPENTNI